MTHVVDGHVHVGLTKYRPIEDFLIAMQQERIDAAVLVQHLGETDNDYLARCVAGGHGRFAGIAIADTAGDADRLLSGCFAGLRLTPGGLPADQNPSTVWRVLDERCGVASITGPFEAVVSAAFRTVVAGHPQVAFRLEHLGWLRYGQESSSQWTDLLQLAAFPNVTVMWSGFFANSSAPYPYPDATPYLEQSLNAFGRERVMWSGDWNRAGLAKGDYREAIQHVRDLPFLDATTAELVLAGNAARLFGLSVPQAVSTEG